MNSARPFLEIKLKKAYFSGFVSKNKLFLCINPHLACKKYFFRKITQVFFHTATIKHNREKQHLICAIWYHLHNFKKYEKHLWRGVTFGEVAGFLRLIGISSIAVLYSCFLSSQDVPLAAVRSSRFREINFSSQIWEKT